MTTLAPDQTLPAQGAWQIDPTHSSLLFEVRDMAQTIATIHGRFTDFEGVIESDGARLIARGVVRTASLTTDLPMRDDHLRSPAFLDTAAHPEARFESDRIDRLDDGRLQISGRLTLKAIEQTVSLEGTLLGTGRDRQDAERLALSAGGVVELGPLRVGVVAHISARKGA